MFNKKKGSENVNSNEGFTPIDDSQFFNPSVDNLSNTEDDSVQNTQFTPLNSGNKKVKKKKSNLNNNGNTGKKKFNPLFIIPIVVGVIVILFIIMALINGSKGNNPVNPPEDLDNPEIVTPVESDPPVEKEPEIIEPVDTSEPEIEEPEDVNKFAYESIRLGIKFNYDSNLYIKENVEEIYNVLKEVTPEGREDFNIFSDKLNGILNVAKLTTGDADGLYISISILPFEIEKETTTLKIDGSMEVKNESIEAINLTDAELIEKYDTQIKEALAQSGCEIVTYDKSYVNGVGSEDKEDGTKRLQGIFTSRVYSGPVDVTTSTGVVDTMQCTIPVGKNAILITAVTDGRPLEIDKSAIFNQIVNSLIVTTEGPIIEETPVETTTPNVTVEGNEIKKES